MSGSKYDRYFVSQDLDGLIVKNITASKGAPIESVWDPVPGQTLRPGYADQKTQRWDDGQGMLVELPPLPVTVPATVSDPNGNFTITVAEIPGTLLLTISSEASPDFQRLLSTGTFAAHITPYATATFTVKASKPGYKAFVQDVTFDNPQSWPITAPDNITWADIEFPTNALITIPAWHDVNRLAQDVIDRPIKNNNDIKQALDDLAEITRLLGWLLNAIEPLLAGQGDIPPEVP